MPERDSSRSTSSTTPEEREPASWEPLLRVAAIGLVAAVVGLAAVGLLGVRSATVASSADGYRLQVTVPSIARPGLAAPFTLELSTTDGATLPDTVTFRIDAAYLAIFDENGLDPDPTVGFNDGRWLWWSFDVPDGATALAVDFDARIEPGVQWRSDGSVAVEIDGRIVTASEFTTWVTP